MKKLLIPWALAVLTACNNPNGGNAFLGGNGAAGRNNTTKGTTATVTPTANERTLEKPLAIVNQSMEVKWEDLRELAIEAAGGQVLMEYVLDRQIERALAELGVKLTDADIEREKDAYLEVLGYRTALTPDEKARALEQVRERNGWGPKRFVLLMKRNAGLRKLIEDQVQVTDEKIRQGFEQRYGEKALVRMILVSDLQTAGRIERELKAKQNSKEAFIELAIAESRDESRFTGGLLPPISAYDFSFPKGLRDEAVRLEPDQLSAVISLESGFALLRGESRIPRSTRRVDDKLVEVKLDDVREEIARDVRIQSERFLMNQKARTLLREARVSVMHFYLNKQWERRREELIELK